MNNCILMAEVTTDPQLRYTGDDNKPIAEMWVQFPGLRDDDQPSSVKVVGWGNLAQEIQQNYHKGDQVIVEGRLGMNTIDRQEGFKEKRAELTAQRIHRVSATMTSDAPPVQSNAAPSAPAAAPVAKTTSKSAPKPPATPPASSKQPAYAGGGGSAEPIDYDEIPFARVNVALAGDPIDFIDPDLSRPNVGREFSRF